MVDRSGCDYLRAESERFRWVLAISDGTARGIQTFAHIQRRCKMIPTRAVFAVSVLSIVQIVTTP